MIYWITIRVQFAFVLCSLTEKMKDPKRPLRNRGTHAGSVSVGPQSRFLFARHRCIFSAVRCTTGQQPDSSAFHSNLPLLCIRLALKSPFPLPPFCCSFKDAIVPAVGLLFRMFPLPKVLQGSFSAALQAIQPPPPVLSGGYATSVAVLVYAFRKTQARTGFEDLRSGFRTVRLKNPCSAMCCGR